MTDLMLPMWTAHFIKLRHEQTRFAFARERFHQKSPCITGHPNMLSETPTSAGLVQEEKSSDLEEAVDRQNTSDTFDSGNDQWVVKWDGVDDPQCPLNTALLKKW